MSFTTLVPTKSVERVQDHPYLVLDQHDSPEDYSSKMGTDRYWADNSINLCHSRCLTDRNKIISSDFNNVNMFIPDNNNPTPNYISWAHNWPVL